ncbi:murein biosynthesis integral membrane protein MurJ [Miniphocaeibacter massiliensis]|uniref:murein biosynthesis integral membrane protein MurJ n=1 Tax=Miniphocaeibacter massiliensis TaxID=2041841 RepID=UPI0013EA7856|nr:murein biosynthesis integral membrane protein MurJ [Miniphocaeibacter massiliensis]
MKNNIAKSSFIILVISLLSKLMGIIRQSIINFFYGQTEVTDAYNIAYRTALLSTFVINTTINLVLIPIMSKVKEKEGIKNKDKYFSKILNYVVIIDILLTILVIIFAPILVKIRAVGFTGEQFDLTVRMVRIIAPSVVFLGVVSCVGAYLHSNYSFGPFAAVGIINNLAFFIFLYIFGENSSIELVAWITTIGAILQAIFLILFMFKYKFKYSIELNYKDNHIKETFILLIPMIMNEMIAQISIIFNDTIGSTLKAGRISVLNTSYNLFGSILNLFVATIATVVYPTLSEAFNSKDFELIKKYIKNGINTMLLFLVPATIGIIVLSEPIVILLFERGEFTRENTVLTQTALICYAIGMVANGIKIYLNKVYFSFQDTITPFKNQIITVVLHIAFALILVKQFEYKGLALASSLSAIITCLILILRLKNKIKDIGFKDLAITFIKVLIASLLMGIVVFITYTGSIKVLGEGTIKLILSTFLSIGLGMLIYILAIYRLKIEEVNTVIEKIRKR